MTEKAISILAKKLAQLVEIFRRGGKASDFHWWNENSPRSFFNPLYGYQDGQPIFEAVVQGVLRLNPEMLSEHEIEHKLVYDFLQPQTISVTQSNHLNGESLINEAENHLKQLVEFEAWQDVDIAIANLWLEGEPTELGKVTFMGVTKEEIDLWKKQGFWGESSPDFRVVARVRAPGDRHKALSYARIQVNQTLDILRAFCFPFSRYSESWRVGLLGDIIASTATPMRINNRDFVIQVSGYGIAQIELKQHIFSKLEQPQWNLINKLTLKKHPNKMESKLLTSIHWLAESTKPDTNNSKFAKISFALETLIGGEPRDEELKVRGITAMLAERAAFIAGIDPNDRLSIDHDIRTYYGKRSNIFHGGEGDVSLDDIDRFGGLVRRLALALLEKLDELGDELGNVEKLGKWVKVQRYTLPEHSSKEVV